MATLASWTPGVDATAAHPAGRIAFVASDADGGTGVHVVDATGAHHRRVAIGTRPRWSPDGSRLAFETGLGLSVVSPDSRDEALVVPLAFDAQWSPDGTRIAHVAARPLPTVNVYYGPPFVFPGLMYELDIAVIRIADGLVTPLTAGAGTDLSPTWSPHASRVAFSRSTFSSYPLLGWSGLESVASAGGVPRQHVRTAWWVGTVRWAPRGSTIAFDGRVDGVTGIWTVDYDGGRGPVLLHETAYGTEGLDWSPDGRFVGFSGGDERDDGLQIVHVVAVDGSAHHHFSGYDVTFSPDGRQVAYCDATGLWRASRDGTEAVRLVASDSCHQPDWGR